MHVFLFVCVSTIKLYDHIYLRGIPSLLPGTVIREKYD